MSGHHCRTSGAERHALDLQRLRSLIGKRLAGLDNERYFFAGERVMDDCGDLQWRCSDASLLSMFLLSDGESVGTDHQPLHLTPAFELDPGQRCEWRAEDLLATLGAGHLAGQLITDVAALFDTWPHLDTSILSGFMVCFEHGDFLVYYNQGDNAVALLNRLPPAAAEFTSTWRSQL